MTRIPTSLARHVPDPPSDEMHIRSMAAAAWHQPRPWVCLPLDEIVNDWLRSGMEALMTERHGRRKPLARR